MKTLKLDDGRYYFATTMSASRLVGCIAVICLGFGLPCGAATAEDMLKGADWRLGHAQTNGYEYPIRVRSCGGTVGEPADLVEKLAADGTVIGPFSLELAEYWLVVPDGQERCSDCRVWELGRRAMALWNDAWMVSSLRLGGDGATACLLVATPAQAAAELLTRMDGATLDDHAFSQARTMLEPRFATAYRIADQGLEQYVAEPVGDPEAALAALHADLDRAGFVAVGGPEPGAEKSTGTIGLGGAEPWARFYVKEGAAALVRYDAATGARGTVFWQVNVRL